MSEQLQSAIDWMRTNAQLTDFFCWSVMDKSGNWFWSASVKINQRSCFVARAADPLTALMDALQQAWQSISKEQGSEQ